MRRRISKILGLKEADTLPHNFTATQLRAYQEKFALMKPDDSGLVSVEAVKFFHCNPKIKTPGTTRADREAVEQFLRENAKVQTAFANPLQADDSSGASSDSQLFVNFEMYLLMIHTCYFVRAQRQREEA